MQSDRSPIVLDLDGVVLQTNGIKHSAMLSLFDVDDGRKRRICDYILSNGGVRRDLKIAHILRAFLGHPEPEDALPLYLSRYAAKLDDALFSAPLVPGVEEFIRHDGYSFHLSSSAPESEVHQQLQTRGLLPCFDAVFGASTPKSEALAIVSAKSPSVLPVFFGDSVGDWEAAQSAGTPFVAVTCERDNFPSLSISKLRDFTSSADVQRAIDAARP